MPPNLTTAPAPAEGVVKLVHLTKAFGDHPPVLRDLSVEFPPRQLTYILGSSGAGKSVLLKHVLGILRPDSGEVWVNGKNMATLSGRELSTHRLTFGMLFQNSALFDDMTVFDNVAFPLREHTDLTEEQIRTKVHETLAILSMPGGDQGYEKFPNELSGGMRKRVALARAIIREPSILLYDEPTTGLDPVTRTTVDQLIETLKTRLGLTSIVISHDLPSALLLADRIAFLHQGEFVFFGSAADFRKSEHPAIRTFLEAELRSIAAFADSL